MAYFGFVDTRVVREVSADPVAHDMEQILPSFMRRRITPTTAAKALVQGIERRAPRVIAPRWWTAVSVLRGIVNPIMDARLARDERVLAVVREGDATPAEPSRPEGLSARPSP